MSDEIEIKEEIIELDLYKQFIDYYDYLVKYDDDLILSALSHTWKQVILYENGKKVGIGRVISDGAIVFFFKDIIVHPDHAHKGYGEKIVSYFLAEALSVNKDAYITLNASKNAKGFYEKLGFAKIPCGHTGAAYKWTCDPE